MNDYVENPQIFYIFLNRYYRKICHELYDKPHLLDTNTDAFRALVAKRMATEEIISLYDEYAESTVSNFMFFIEELIADYDKRACRFFKFSKKLGAMYSVMEDTATYIYDNFIAMFNKFEELKNIQTLVKHKKFDEAKELLIKHGGIKE